MKETDIINNIVKLTCLNPITYDCKKWLFNNGDIGDFHVQLDEDTFVDGRQLIGALQHKNEIPKPRIISVDERLAIMEKLIREWKGDVLSFGFDWTNLTGVNFKSLTCPVAEVPKGANFILYAIRNLSLIIDDEEQQKTIGNIELSAMIRRKDVLKIVNRKSLTFKLSDFTVDYINYIEF